MAIKIKVLKTLKLGKTLDHKSLGKKAPIDLVVGEVYEVNEKWEEKIDRATCPTSCSIIA
jgi:hypothetical protein